MHDSPGAPDGHVHDEGVSSEQLDHIGIGY